MTIATTLKAQRDAWARVRADAGLNDLDLTEEQEAKVLAAYGRWLNQVPDFQSGDLVLVDISVMENSEEVVGLQADVIGRYLSTELWYVRIRPEGIRELTHFQRQYLRGAGGLMTVDDAYLTPCSTNQMHLRSRAGGSFRFDPLSVVVRPSVTLGDILAADDEDEGADDWD